MFGASNPFGQSSNSPFGTTQPAFGQTSNASNNPFAPKPFGSPTSPFGAQTGSSIFGGTSTGMFGTPQTSSFSATNAFGSSTPAFGSSSTPAFGASSTPAFGASSSSAFGGSSVFGQKPFGGFGSTAQASPFGSTNQQSQPAFGNSLFGSTPFGAPTQSAFGATSTPAFGATSTPAFGTTSTPPPFGSTNTTQAFGATSTTPAFGSTSTTPAFGSTSTAPAFGAPSSTPAFGAPSTAPAFGSTATPGFGSTGTTFTSSPLFGTGGAFGTSTTSGFGASTTTPAFGNSTVSAFGTPTTSAFGATSSPSFTFSSSPGFGQSASAFGSSPFGSTTSTFPAQTSPFGAQSTTSPFGNNGFAQSGFGAQRPGSRASPYAETAEAEGGAQAGKLLSISAMTAYKDKSHEELRWEDYQLGDKGGPLPAGQSPGGGGFNVSASQPNPFAPPTGLGQTSANIFSSTTTNLFAPKTQTSTPSFNTTSFGPSTSSNLFQSSTTPAFSAGSSPSPFGSTSTPSFSSTPSLFSSTVGQGTVSPFGSSMFNNTQPSLSFPSTTPSLGQPTAFSQPSPFGPSTTSSLFSSPSTGGLFSSTPSQITPNLGGFNQMTPSQPAPFQMSQPAQNAGAFALNFSQTQAAGMSGFAGVSNNLGQLSTSQSAVAIQPVPVTNPFGTLPAMPQMSIGRAGTTPSVQYGISSMPVIEKPSPVRVSSLLTSRHLSQRRIRLPARKYYPKHDGPKVPFFSDEEETPSTPKADALFIPRENPRALVIRPMDQWPSRASAEKASPVNASAPVHENGKNSESDFANLSNGYTAGDKNKNLAENGVIKEQALHVKVNQKPNGVHEDHSAQKEESYMTLSGHRAGEAAIVYEHGADIEALMPKLRRSDYFTEPRIQELAAKERAKPGFCRLVKDFVVGRHGYGSIKFSGETDVRRLDLESLVQFNNREVIVYMDDSKKPPVGQGLNKPAEVTLLNIKCFDKKTGHQFTEGPKIEKYKEMLKRKAEDQGAEFVSYDPVKGEWKFKVHHFSKYMLEEEEEDRDAQATADC